jgi:HD-GYP domain-containing protein (c-di-GMP phosphodiesterase class II)
MMTICDIYDALTASDRPYKAAVPASRALEILEGYAKEGKVDAALLALFIDTKVYRATEGTDRTPRSACA